MNLRGTEIVEEVVTVTESEEVVEAVSDGQREEAKAEIENAKENAESVIAVIVVSVLNGRGAVAGTETEEGVLQNQRRKGLQGEEEVAVGQKTGDDPERHPD